MTTKLLVTGGAGFVGTNLIASLSARGGYTITVLDNESMGRCTDIEAPVTFIRGDIREEKTLVEAMAGQNVVVHLAADTRVMESIEDPKKNFDVNVLGSFRLLNAARATGVNRVIAASTGGAILGEAPAPVNEEMVAHPLAPYGASKLAMEGYLSAFGAAYGMKTASLRFSNVYGPKSYHKGSVVAHFFKRLLNGESLTVYGDGSQARDYLFVDDLVEGIHCAIEADATGVYQLGTGRPTTINELIAAMGEATGLGELPVRYADFRPGEIHTTYCDISKARQAFGYAPRTGLVEGLARTWAWFQDAYDGAADDGGRRAKLGNSTLASPV